MVKITLYVPTYNRSSRLKKSLMDLIGFIGEEKLNSIVDILVGDNCSTDATSVVLQDTKIVANELGIKFNYFKNISNLGFNENVKQGYLKFEGDFIIFISDDDNLFPGALTQYLKILIEMDPFVALINFDQPPFTTASPLYKNDILFLSNQSDFFEPLILSPKLTGIALKMPKNYSLREEIASAIIPSYFIAHVALAIHQYSKLGRGLHVSKFFAYPDTDFKDHITFLPYVTNLARFEIDFVLRMINNAEGEQFRRRILELIPSRIVIDDSINWLLKYYLFERNLTREQFYELWSNCLRYFYGHTSSKRGLSLKDSSRKFKRIKIMVIILLRVKNEIWKTLGFKYANIGEKGFEIRF
jgi:glycosyltransferase involved in cell wall biosynthesis